MAQQRNTISSSPRSLRSLRLLTCSTTVENVRQIGPRFCKTKPIFRRKKIHVSAVLTKDYEEKITLCEPTKTNPNKANRRPVGGSSKHQATNRRQACAFNHVQRRPWATPKGSARSFFARGHGSQGRGHYLWTVVYRNQVY